MESSCSFRFGGNADHRFQFLLGWLFMTFCSVALFVFKLLPSLFGWSLAVVDHLQLWFCIVSPPPPPPPTPQYHMVLCVWIGFVKLEKCFRIEIYSNTEMRTHTNTMHTRVCLHTHTLTHKRMNVHVYKNMRTHKHTQNTHTHTHTHTHLDSPPHIKYHPSHTHTLTLSLPLKSSYYCFKI